jgi:hypothetical protein
LALPRNFRKSSLFIANCKNCPSARCVSAIYHLWTHVDIFRKPAAPWNQILYWFEKLSNQLLDVFQGLMFLCQYSIYIVLLLRISLYVLFCFVDCSVFVYLYCCVLYPICVLALALQLTFMLLSLHLNKHLFFSEWSYYCSLTKNILLSYDCVFLNG